MFQPDAPNWVRCGSCFLCGSTAQASLTTSLLPSCAHTCCQTLAMETSGQLQLRRTPSGISGG